MCVLPVPGGPCISVIGISAVDAATAASAVVLDAAVVVDAVAVGGWCRGR